MNAIPPINGPEDPHLVQRVTVDNPSSASAQNVNIENTFGLQIDPAKIQQDQVLLVQTLEDVVSKARSLYSQGLYSNAEKLYQSFFYYYDFLHDKQLNYSEPLKVYFPVLQEYSYLLAVEHDQNTAQKFLNQQLTRSLESLIASQVPKNQVAQLNQAIRLQQQASALPSPTQPNIKVSPDTLVQLSQQFRDAGALGAARTVLGHLEVRQFLDILQTRQQVTALTTQAIRPAFMNVSPDAFYNHWGLPLLGMLPPLPAEERKKIQSTRYVPKFKVNKVEPVDPVDPNAQNLQELERQERREKRSRHWEAIVSRKTSAVSVDTVDLHPADDALQEDNVPLKSVKAPAATRHPRIGSL